MKGKGASGALVSSESAPALRSRSPKSLRGPQRQEGRSKRHIAAPERTLLNVAAKRRAKRAGKAEGARGKEMFHRVKVPVDESAAEYMPYDSITFPKLESGAPREVADAQMDSMWMVGFLDHERQRWVGKAKRKTEGLRQLPGGELPPSAKEELDRLEVQRQKKFARPGPAFQLPAPEMERLKELAREVEEEEQSPVTGFESAFHAYGGANRKIGQLVRKGAAKRRRRQGRPQRQQRSKAAGAAGGTSQAMEELVRLERVQTQACIFLQRAVRAFLRRQWWRAYMRRSKAAAVIQAYARGMVTRKVLRRWYARRHYVISMAQAAARGHFERQRLAVIHAVKTYSCKRVQAAFRGALARRRLRLAGMGRAAAAIQRAWRCAVARQRVHQLYLDKHATRIQATMRRYLARESVARLRRQLTGAAVTLQRQARKRRNELMFARDAEDRRLEVLVLGSELEMWREELASRQKKFEDARLRDKIQRAAKEVCAAREEVRRLEFDYISLRREREQVSPRAIEQGWTHQLDRNVGEFREKVTNAKLRFLFGPSRRLQRLLSLRTELVERVREAVWYVEHYTIWQQTEMDLLTERENERRWHVRRRERDLSVAEERRRWRVRWYTQSGKPDKRRREGHPWDPSVYADEHAAGYSLGAEAATEADMGPVAGLVNAAQGQAMTNQLVQYSSLLKPFMEAMEGPGKRVTKEKKRADARRNRRAERERRWRERLRRAAAGEIDAVESPSSSSADEEEENAKRGGGGGGGGVLGFDASAVREGEVGEATVVQRERRQRGGGATEKRHALWSLLDELEEEKAKLERERTRAARYGIK